MPKPKFAEVDPVVLAAYMAAIAATPGAEPKGATRPYTSVNGNMTSSISGDNVIGLRLAPADRLAFCERFDTTLFEGLPGFIQKEYVAVPASMLTDAPTLAQYFKLSFEYVSRLKPKPTTRGSKS